jgi:transglutaminase-like putative cysteine protease
MLAIRIARTFSIFAFIGLCTFGLHWQAAAQCRLTITSAYMSDGNGNAYAPKVGDPYWVTFYWTVTGTPNSKYNITLTEANQTSTWTGLPAAPGNYWGIMGGWTLPLDGAIPVTITLDSGNTTGYTNVAGAVLKGHFTPVPPAIPVQYFNPLRHVGAETYTVNWKDGSGTVSTGFTLMGVPTTDSFQQVLGASGPVGSIMVLTAPGSQPVWETNYTNYTPVAGNDTWTCTQNFVVVDSNMRVNPTLLRQATWAQLAAIPHIYWEWLQPDLLVQSTDPAVKAFVNSVLPAKYQLTMTPYDAARALFLAVVKNTTYLEPPGTNGSAVSTLKTGLADCLGFSTLLAACLRSIGIPSRPCCGWWTGTNQWHCTNEFYLPGCGWIGSDATEDKLWWDPTGTYAYMFGADTWRNGFCEVSRGTDHHAWNFAVTELQVGWLVATGTAICNGQNDTCSLQ